LVRNEKALRVSLDLSEALSASARAMPRDL